MLSPNENDFSALDVFNELRSELRSGRTHGQGINAISPSKALNSLRIKKTALLDKIIGMEEELDDLSSDKEFIDQQEFQLTRKLDSYSQYIEKLPTISLNKLLSLIDLIKYLSWPGNDKENKIYNKDYYLFRLIQAELKNRINAAFNKKDFKFFLSLLRHDPSFLKEQIILNTINFLREAHLSATTKSQKYYYRDFLEKFGKSLVPIRSILRGFTSKQHFFIYFLLFHHIKECMTLMKTYFRTNPDEKYVVKKFQRILSKIFSIPSSHSDKASQIASFCLYDFLKNKNFDFLYGRALNANLLEYFIEILETHSGITYSDEEIRRKFLKNKSSLPHELLLYILTTDQTDSERRALYFS